MHFLDHHNYCNTLALLHLYVGIYPNHNCMNFAKLCDLCEIQGRGREKGLNKNEIFLDFLDS